MVINLKTLPAFFSQQPKINSNHHFGSRLVWAPDGTLFITLGDRYSEKERAQTLDNHLGKVVRIHADGSVPKDNPFVNTAGALPEIWSYGHRNMQGAQYIPLAAHCGRASMGRRAAMSSISTKRVKTMAGP